MASQWPLMSNVSFDLAVICSVDTNYSTSQQNSCQLTAALESAGAISADDVGLSFD